MATIVSHPDASVEDLPRPQRQSSTGGSASARTLRGLDWLNFFLADVQTGVGPFVAIYLAGHAWNEERVGLALTVGAIAGVATQTPMGALVDQVHHKRALTAAGVLALAVGALVIAFFPSFWPVMVAQALVGSTASVFVPVVCAISLGLVGRAAFDARQGRNQTFNAAGNVVAAVMMGALGYWLSNRAIFFFVVALGVPTVLSLLAIRPQEIDHARARGAKEGSSGATAARFRTLLEDRPLLVFLVCAVLFHFANAAMLPLVGEMLSKGKGRSSMFFMAACVVTTQLVITVLASSVGRRASARGRKPLLLLAFAVLPLRGLLYTLTHVPALLVAIQILDGIGVGIFGVVQVLVIADRTRGTGRFNLAIGAVNTAVGVGAALSQVIAGGVVHRMGYRAGFLFLAAIAAVAFGILYLFMPETREMEAEAKPEIADGASQPAKIAPA